MINKALQTNSRDRFECQQPTTTQEVFTLYSNSPTLKVFYIVVFSLYKYRSHAWIYLHMLYLFTIDRGIHPLIKLRILQ